MQRLQHRGFPNAGDIIKKVGQGRDAISKLIQEALALEFQLFLDLLGAWQRGQTLGAERFEKELLAYRAAAQRSQAQRRLIPLLAGDCAQETVESYLRGLADFNRALARQITELLHLIRQYGP